MFDFLKGTVADVRQNAIVLAVGGVGYRLMVAAPTCAHATRGSTMTLYTALFVREPHIELYGFISPQERELFLLLTGISGIGPKMALALLTLGDPQTIADAIAREDRTFLTTVPGIGPKAAQRIITELKDKVVATNLARQQEKDPQDADAVLEALLALGYRKKEVLPAMREVLATHAGEPVGTLVRRILQTLAQ